MNLKAAHEYHIIYHYSIVCLSLSLSIELVISLSGCLMKDEKSARAAAVILYTRFCRLLIQRVLKPPIYDLNVASSHYIVVAAAAAIP